MAFLCRKSFPSKALEHYKPQSSLFIVTIVNLCVMTLAIITTETPSHRVFMQFLYIPSKIFSVIHFYANPNKLSQRMYHGTFTNSMWSDCVAKLDDYLKSLCMFDLLTFMSSIPIFVELELICASKKGQFNDKFRDRRVSFLFFALAISFAWGIVDYIG